MQPDRPHISLPRNPGYDLSPHVPGRKVVNLRSARQLGLTIPERVLLRVDHTIE